MWETINNVKDGIWLNPKCCINGQSAAKLQTGEGSTTRFVKSYRLENKGENPEYL